ncbi:MAG: hypothetical protein IJF50_07265 [Peptococcaceae bacterium]|nr:hypothetical protein [Peptococcaceae bacterium]MBQ3119767.1 hypothetical protein [Peptococcaceae bacterium]
MKKIFQYEKIYSRISLTMFLIAILFVSYAMRHPESGIPGFPLELTWLFYTSYAAIMVLFAVLSLLSAIVSYITK